MKYHTIDIYDKDGNKVATIGNDKDGLNTVRIVFSIEYGQYEHFLDPEVSIAIANTILRKIDDMRRWNNLKK